jgi:hypothetical protein
VIVGVVVVGPGVVGSGVVACGWTTPVAFDLAVFRPPRPEARTSTRIRLPMSAERMSYVDPRAPSTALHAAPAALHLSHTYE